MRALVLAGAYVLAAKAGLDLLLVGKQVSPVWPPSGLALAAVVFFGWRIAPVAFVAMFLVGRAAGPDVQTSLLMAVGNLVEAYLGRALLAKLGFDPRQERVRDVLSIVGVALVAPVVSSVCGAFANCLGGYLPWADMPRAVLTWWVGNAMGIMVVAPVAFSFASTQWRRPSIARVIEALALALLLLVVGGTVFSRSAETGAALYAQAFLPFPLAMWAATRFGVRGASLTSLALAAAAVAGTAAGLGPFAHAVRVEGVILVQVFIATVELSSLVLAAVTSERTRATEQAELLASALRKTQEGVLILDSPASSGRVLFANEGFSKLSGYSPGELEQRGAAVLLGPPTDAQTLERFGERLARGESARGDVVLLRRDGAPFEVEVHVDPVRDERGREWFVSTHRDTTERRQTQARLLLTERLASLGQLAAAMGHEINNPLSFTMANLQFVERELMQLPPADVARLAPVRGAVDQALDGAERVRRIVRDLRLFIRPGEEVQKPVDLNAAIERALTLAANELRHRARLVRELGTVPRVDGSEARLVQLWVNLFVNAAHAIPEGAADQHEIRVRTSRREDGRARVEVSDSGVGIPPQTLSRVFEPFFTTKGHGTGLGLAISKQIVDDHGGEIRACSEPGRGTTFTVDLPASTAPVPEVAVAPLVRPSRRAKVLVIDDEVHIGQSMKLLLEPDHEVTATTSGREALEWLDTGLQFDVIFCDLQMPHSSGMEIHARLSAANPEAAARMVFVSGGAFTDAARAFLRRVQNPVLEKPVRPEVLFETIERALGDRARGPRA